MLSSIIPMNYYGRNDITLGEFLQRYCFRHMYMCQSCDVEMAKHQRHFIHGTLELRVSMHTLPASVASSSDTNVYTWLSCSQCPNVSVLGQHHYDVWVLCHVWAFFIVRKKSSNFETFPASKNFSIFGLSFLMKRKINLFCAGSWIFFVIKEWNFCPLKSFFTLENEVFVLEIISCPFWIFNFWVLGKQNFIWKKNFV